MTKIEIQTVKQFISHMEAMVHFMQKLLAEEIAMPPEPKNDHEKLKEITSLVNAFEITPNGTEGYAKAEVTLGGINVDQISSKTFEAKSVPNLFFIGEVLDVTGWLGGFNFQWAWASGKAAGENV